MADSRFCKVAVCKMKNKSKELPSVIFRGDPGGLALYGHISLGCSSCPYLKCDDNAVRCEYFSIEDTILYGRAEK